MSTLPASAARRALRRAAFLLLVAAPAAPAGAQDACASGSLAQYLTAGFACRIGAWTLHEFSANSSTRAAGGAKAVAAEMDAVRITPFVGVDGADRATFGFDLGGMHTAAGSHGTTSGIERANAFASLGFWLVADAPGRTVAGVQAFGTFEGSNLTPGVLRVGSTYGGSAFSLDGGFVDCAVGFANSTAPGGPPASVGGDCARPLSGRIFVNMGASSTADRIGALEGTLDGFSGVALTRVAFTEGAPAVVPEPATVALVAGGLVGLAGVGARKRRAG
jgi:hypothetical protein